MKNTLLILLACLSLNLISCKEELCNDTCWWPEDGECDDGGEGSINDYCEFGTDCSDCGTRKER